MKYKLSRSLVLSFIFASVTLIFPKLSLAASFWFNPTSGSYSQGSTLKVSVGLNTAGVAINAVQANISYPADKLQFVTVSTGGSALAIIAEKTGGGGLVKIAGGTQSPGFTGSKLLATVYFKVLTSSGSATIITTGDSAALKDADNQNALTGSTSATYTLSAASTKSETSPTATAAPKSPFAISQVSASAITTESVTIAWKTDREATSSVEYGQSQAYGLTVTSDVLTQEHALQITGLLIPGSVYHYRVISKDKDGVEIASEDNTFQVEGYKVTVKVRDGNDNPVLGAKVTLYSPSVDKETDGDGVAVFSDVSLGKHGLVVRHAGSSKILEIDVVNNIDPHEVVVTFAQPSLLDSIRNSKYFELGVGLVLGLVVVGALLFVITKIIRGVRGGGGSGGEKVNIVIPPAPLPPSILTPPMQGSNG